jgi:hypothetical protein
MKNIPLIPIDKQETLEETELVPYEQSLALKELGFDKLCFTYFLNSFLQPAFIARDYSYFNEMSEINPNMLNYEYVLAPTFSQAFKFFRETYNLHSCVAPVYEDETKKVILYWFWIQGFDDFDSENIDYKTPEEAELACLNKLIEIVKESLSTDFMNKFFKETWEVVETDIDFSKHTPSETRGSLHVHEERYDIDNEIYRLLYSLGHDYPPIIEKLKKEL